MSTEVDETPEKLEIGKTSVILDDPDSKLSLEFETVGQLSLKVEDGSEKVYFINAYVPTKEDGSQDDSKDIIYCATDEAGVPVPSEEAQVSLVDLFIAEVTKEEEK
jgi:hypothetical protein